VGKRYFVVNNLTKMLVPVCHVAQITRKKLAKSLESKSLSSTTFPFEALLQK